MKFFLFSIFILIGLSSLKNAYSFTPAELVTEFEKSVKNRDLETYRDLFVYDYYLRDGEFPSVQEELYIIEDYFDWIFDGRELRDFHIEEYKPEIQGFGKYAVFEVPVVFTHVIPESDEASFSQPSDEKWQYFFRFSCEFYNHEDLLSSTGCLLFHKYLVDHKVPVGEGIDGNWGLTMIPKGL
mgnify:FL=1